MKHDWQKLSNSEKKEILQKMSKEDIKQIKNLVEMFDAKVLTIKIIENETLD